MNYHELANNMRSHAEAAAGRIPKPRMAEISSYNPATYSVKVTFQGVGDSDSIESGWIPLDAMGVGNRFGVVTAPNVRDMVKISFTDGSGSAPKIDGRYFSNVNVPLAVPAGETWIVHKSGASMKFTTDGKVTVRDAAGSTVVMNADGTGTMTFAAGLTINANTQINGTLKASGDITDNSGSNSRTMAGMRSVYNTHTHPVANVQGGGSTVTSNAPNQTE
jgi:uncharacterized protein involved in type VI secretion and phage assembly